MSPSPPFPLDPFLSGRVGGGSATRYKFSAAGVAALDPCPRSRPTPAASAGGGGGGATGRHPPARGAWVCPAAASAGPTTGPVSGTHVRLLPAKKRPRLARLAVSAAPAAPAAPSPAAAAGPRTTPRAARTDDTEDHDEPTFRNTQYHEERTQSQVDGNSDDGNGASGEEGSDEGTGGEEGSGESNHGE